MKLSFVALLKKFSEQGEKTGWTYFEIPYKLADKINPGIKKSFRVKGTIDQLAIKQVAILPMGNGDFIMPVNGDMRKILHKKNSDKIEVVLELDQTVLNLSPDFLTCLEDEPIAKTFFESLPKSHQQYYSKWIETAKTEATKTKRIAIVVNGLARQMNFGAMLREQRDINKLTR